MTPEQSTPRGCPVTVWDGPYSHRCGLGASVGRCAYHGPFDLPDQPEQSASLVIQEVARMMSPEQLVGSSPEQRARWRHTAREYVASVEEHCSRPGSGDAS